MRYLDSVTSAIEAVLAWEYVPEELFSDAVAAQACLLTQAALGRGDGAPETFVSLFECGEDGEALGHRSRLQVQ